MTRRQREAQARAFARQVRPFLGQSASLRAGAVPVTRAVVRRAPAHLRSKGAASRAAAADLRFAAKHGECQAGKVREGWGLTVADHPDH